MNRSLPKLLPGVRVESHGTGAQLVVDLALPGQRPKRLSASLWAAVALLDAHDDVASWLAAVREREPSFTDARAHKLLAALTDAGLAAEPGDVQPQTVAQPRKAAPPRPPPSNVDVGGIEVEVSDLLELSGGHRRPTFSQEITQVAELPMRPPIARRDLTAQRTEQPERVRVTVPGGAAFEMAERDYRILLELDGVRDLRTVHAALVARGASFSFEQLAVLVSSMVRRGLVIDDAAALIAAPSADAAPRPAAAPPGERTATLERPIDLPGEAQPETAEPTGSVPQAEAPAPADVTAAEGDAPGGAAAEGVWDAADVVATSPEARKRRRDRRLRQLLRYGAAPAALLLLGLVVRWPLTITYECEIEPLESRTVRSPIDGVLALVAVDEGERVKLDQVLGNLDNGALKLELVKNKAVLERAAAELELLKQGTREEEVDRAQARINGLANEAGIASSRLKRVRGLVKQGVAPREEQDRAAGELAAIMGQLQQARADMKLLLAGARPDDIKKKEAEINSLTAQVDVSERQLAATVLKAPMAGVVTTQKPKDKINTKVTVGDAIFEVVAPEKMRATVLVSERDFDVLRKGLPIKVKVSAYPVDEFAGEVVRVAEKVERLPTGNIIRAEGVIDNADGKLVPHMTGFAEIRGEPRPLVALLGRRVLRWVRVRFLI
ncbi:MAG: hypothetical protein A2138_07190 [Deltaproteobacteria bacterium RBG_16_71_12]|nr:MAG: hypothetical protein A2138_07190 [Deltaproteobacteria bacterium RBG_16_71_12]